MTTQEGPMDKLEDVWHSRDLPVLREVTRRVDEGAKHVPRGDLVEATGLDDETVTRGLASLDRQGLIVPDRRGGQVMAVMNVAPRAYALTGLYPSGEEFRERMVAVLEQLAEQTSDPEERSKIKGAARQLGILSRDTLAAVAAAVATGGISAG